MINIKSQLWLVDLDGTMYDDRYRLQAYAGDPEDSESWIQYHDNWGIDRLSTEMVRFVNLIPENDWLFFVSLRHQKHWEGTREHLKDHLKRDRFGLFLYEKPGSKYDSWRIDVDQIHSIVKQKMDANKDIQYSGTFLVDNSSWRLQILRQKFWDAIHFKIELPNQINADY